MFSLSFVKRSITVGLFSIIGLSTLGQNSAVAQVSNGGFENGFTDWTTFGDAQVTGAFSGSNPPEGSNHARLSPNTMMPLTIPQLADILQTDDQTLTDFLTDGFGDVPTMLQASGIQQVISATAGDQFSFQSNLFSNTSLVDAISFGSGVIDIGNISDRTDNFTILSRTAGSFEAFNPSQSFDGETDYTLYTVDVPFTADYLVTQGILVPIESAQSGILPVDPSDYAVLFDDYQLIPLANTGNPGSTQNNPIFPTSLIPGGFIIEAANSGDWVDPPLTDTYTYSMISESLFTRILDFPTGFNDLFTVSVGDNILGQFAPGEMVDFTSFPGGGVPTFTVSDINPLVDVEDPEGFPLRLEFNTPTASFMMQAPSVPESSTNLALLGLGILGITSSLRRVK